MMEKNEREEALIIIVDDMIENLQFLEMVLKKAGFHVFSFTNGTSALNALSNFKPDLFILDIRMPEMNGFELCNLIRQKKEFENTPILFISGLADVQTKVEAFRAGGSDYISKPFQVEEILARAETHIHNGMLQKQIEENNRCLQKKVDEQVKEISDSQIAAIVSLAKLAESRDDDTGKHIERVQSFCRILVEEVISNSELDFELSPSLTENIFYASALHDVGKVGIPDSILLKPGKLTPEEFDIMKQHTQIGSHSLEIGRKQYLRNEFLDMGIIIARYHHERWDGLGYPEGLAEEQIPMPARIMSIADVYDALRAKRTYKPAFSHEKSVNIILEGGGTQFDPLLTSIFSNVEDKFEKLWTDLSQNEFVS